MSTAKLFSESRNYISSEFLYIEQGTGKWQLLDMYLFSEYIKGFLFSFPLSGVTWDILGHILTLLSFHLTWKKLESPVTRSIHCSPSIISPACVTASHEGPGLSRQMKSYESQREQKISAVQCSSGAGVLKEQVAWPRLLGEPPRP